MSNYTTQLRFICESYAGLTSPTDPMYDIDDIIEAARSKVFSFDYPLFDPNYKKELESKIISHFYTREIGVETVGLFKHRLKNKMREIMPYYNQLYKSELIKFDPLKNVDYTDENKTDTVNHGETKGDRKDKTEVNRNIGSERDITTTGTDATDYGKVTHNEAEQVDTKEYNSDVIKDFGHTNHRGGNDVKSHNGVDTDVKTPLQITETLVKHSDTPQGAVSNVVADNSNYLSDVTQTVNTVPDGITEQVASNYNSNERVDYDVTDTEGGQNAEHKRGTDTDTLNFESTETLSGRDTDTHNSHTDDDYTETGKETTDYTSDTSGTSDDTGTRDYLGHIFGKQGTETYSEMLMKFRETFLNIDMDIIKELEPLFMQIY